MHRIYDEQPDKAKRGRMIVDYERDESIGSHDRDQEPEAQRRKKEEFLAALYQKA